MEFAENGPEPKRHKGDNGDSNYIPTQPSQQNGNNTGNASLIFSIHEQQGELIKSLKPFEVSTYLRYLDKTAEG